MPDTYYNRENFPRFVVNHGAWDIYANTAGHCAAIPTDEAGGYKASNFGTADYVAVTLGVTVEEA